MAKVTGKRAAGQDRIKRRVMVRFSDGETHRSGFSKNLSETGLFVQTNLMPQPGALIQVELSFPDRKFSMWARVMWGKKVPPQLAHILECGMGLRFENPPADWPAYYKEW